MISVIIPTMKGREQLLSKLTASLPKCEVIVVDDSNLLLAAKRNKGARLAKGDYFFFVDDDNYLKDGALEKMMKMFDETIGVMGMTACYTDKKMRIADGGSLRNFTTGFTIGLRTNDSVSEIYYPSGLASGELLYEVDEVANAFMIPRHVFEEVGGFDEENFPIDLDEADICKRIKNMGYKVVMNPKAICYHKSITYSHIPDFRRPMNAYFMGRNRVLFQRKHTKGINYILYLCVFNLVFVSFYVASLVYRKKFSLILHFLKGVLDGIQGRKQNQFQQS